MCDRAAGVVAESDTRFTWTVLSASPTVEVLAKPHAESSGSRTPFVSFRAVGVGTLTLCLRSAHKAIMQRRMQRAG
jgi:hypothetical protein